MFYWKKKSLYLFLSIQKQGQVIDIPLIFKKPCVEVKTSYLVNKKNDIYAVW